MKIFFAIVSVLAVGIAWALERMAGADLRTRLGALQQESRERDGLQRERERLRQLQPEPQEVASLQLSAAEYHRLQTTLGAREQPGHHPAPAQLAVGEWVPLTAWKNQGQETPAAVVETILWAAAGGDVKRLQSLLQIHDGASTKATELLERLPAVARALYPSPGHLIAAFTTKAIPLGDAQLVWQHQSGEDDAVACVFAKNTEPAIAIMPQATASSPGKMPPMGPPSTTTKSAYLSLRRSDGAWRVVVPLSAVEKIAQELTGTVLR